MKIYHMLLFFLSFNKGSNINEKELDRLYMKWDNKYNGKKYSKVGWRFTELEYWAKKKNNNNKMQSLILSYIKKFKNNL